jgi:hypothetical protein
LKLGKDIMEDGGVQNSSTVLPLHQYSIPDKKEEEVIRVNNESTVQWKPTGAWAKKLFAQNVEARGSLVGSASSKGEPEIF